MRSLVVVYIGVVITISITFVLFTTEATASSSPSRLHRLERRHHRDVIKNNNNNTSHYNEKRGDIVGVSLLSPPAYSTPQCIVCTQCATLAFENKERGGKRHALVLTGPKSPGADVNSFSNSRDASINVFSILISSASAKGMVLTLLNTKSANEKAAPNSAGQHSIYRINLFNEKGHSQSTYLWLQGYDKCNYEIKNPYNIYGFFLPNAVVLNTLT